GGQLASRSPAVSGRVNRPPVYLIAPLVIRVQLRPPSDLLLVWLGSTPLRIPIPCRLRMLSIVWVGATSLVTTPPTDGHRFARSGRGARRPGRPPPRALGTRSRPRGRVGPQRRLAWYQAAAQCAWSHR